jgi:hypothetical protein
LGFGLFRMHFDGQAAVAILVFLPPILGLCGVIATAIVWRSKPWRSDPGQDRPVE